MTLKDVIVIATDFSEAPGARYRADGPKSGEEFLDTLLRPRFLSAKEAQRTLLVDLDGAWGYASSFVSGSFGALAREFGATAVHRTLRLKSDEDRILLDNVRREIDSEGNRG
jgi:hypothetical protein